MSAEKQRAWEAPELVDLGSALEIIQGAVKDCMEHHEPGRFGTAVWRSPMDQAGDRYDDIVG